MVSPSKGIHHITAIVGNPQENVDFYGRVLGMRLSKKTVNHDDPETYHLYFSNGDVDPGTHITFFPWEDAMQGKVGDGQVGVTVYAIPFGSMDFWRTRLQSFGVDVEEVTRFDTSYLHFNDPHGLNLELVERKKGKRSSYTYGDITVDKAIKGFDGAVLYSQNPEATKPLLRDVLGLKPDVISDDYERFKGEGEFGDVIDLKIKPADRGFQGVGTVHHIAFRAAGDAHHKTFRELVDKKGYHVTPFIDRKYFKSIYFRETGKILFEIATDGPGFDVDEPSETLGDSLTLPERYEPYRKRIESRLKPLEVPRG